MKLSDCIIEAPDTGECKLNLDKLVKKFGEHSTISRWHEKFRLVNLRAHVKVTISEADAKEIIRRLNLVEHNSPLFANASTFMTLSRLNKVKEHDRIPMKMFELYKNLEFGLNQFDESDQIEVIKRLIKVLRSKLK